jgi:hypothetical protein
MSGFKRIWILTALAHGVFAGGLLGEGHRPRLLLFDDYYQHARAGTFIQGVPPEAKDRFLSNSYLPDATGIPNGTFVWSRLVSRDYDVKISHAPISELPLDSAGAYMMVCPIPKDKGGQGEIQAEDVRRLEAFVGQGGILILVLNSLSGPNDNVFDRRGMNLVARPFGFQFEATTSQTLLIPIARDHPVFVGVPNLIYGNGTTIEYRDVPPSNLTVLAESTNEKVPGAVAIRVRYKQGTVLALGDSGTLGNAHALRSESGQADALYQMMHCLLPDGPLPAYGWRKGLRMRVKLWHQEVMSGYPNELRLFDLPLSAGAKLVEADLRDIDLKSAGTANGAPPPPPAAVKRGFASAVAEWRKDLTLSLGAFDGKAYRATWSAGQGNDLRCRLTPRGITLDQEVGSPELAPWRWALANAVLVSPLDPVAQVGDEWEAPMLLTPLPNAQLEQSPGLREADGKVKFQGTELCRGKDCFVLGSTVVLKTSEFHPQDLVNSAYADYFSRQDIRLSSAGQLVYVKTWIEKATGLPVRTELRATSDFWWEGSDQPDGFISTHDAKRIYEDRKTTRRVVTFGRLLTADYEVEKMP